MPLVTVTVRKPKSNAFKTTVLDAVHSALVSSGVPAADKFQRVLELDAEDFRFDPNYPNGEAKRRLRSHRNLVVGGPQRQGKEENARGSHGNSGPCRSRPGERHGVLQGNVLGELGVCRGTAPAHVR